MSINPVVLAIPLFFLLMAAEVIYEYFHEHKTYRLNDALTNISTGILNQITGLFAKVITVGVYTALYESAALFHLPQTTANFLLVFLLYDLCYYWSHRMAHEVSLFWGGHVVHHQSEEYNLSVALRQSATSFIWSMPFYLPLALLGFHPLHFLLAGGLNLIYQFWIHTDHIGKLGPLEWVMNTPSHHRVHHARDPKYIDKNYAGVFIIWDRIFGTFKAEEERPHYGITKPLNSWNPIYANFAHYLYLLRQIPKTRSWKDRVGILLRRPGWRPEYLGGPILPQEIRGEPIKYNQGVKHPGWNAYILLQFLLSLTITALFLFQMADFSSFQQVSMAIWISYTTFVFGWMLQDAGKWPRIAEALRLLMLPVTFWWISQTMWITLVFSGWSLISLVVITSMKKEFLNKIPSSL